MKSDVPMALLDPGLNGSAGLPNVDLPKVPRDIVYASYFQVESSLTGIRKMAIVLCRKPRVLFLCLDSALLMRFKFSPTKATRSTDVGSSPNVSSLRDGLRSRWICLSMWLFHLNVETDEFKFSLENFLIVDESSSLYQCG